jgi:hypothetical protein
MGQEIFIGRDVSRAGFIGSHDAARQSATPADGE